MPEIFFAIIMRDLKHVHPLLELNDTHLECLNWLCPWTIVGWCFRDFLLKSMMMIQGDGHTTGRSDHVRGAISLGTPTTLYIDLKERKAIPGGVHIVSDLTGQKSLEKQEQSPPCLYLPMLKKKPLLWYGYFKYQKVVQML